MDVTVSRTGGRYEVEIKALRPRPMVLHWGINDWNSAPAEARPAGTVQIDDKAVQTPFQGGQHVKLSFPEVRVCTVDPMATCEHTQMLARSQNTFTGIAQQATFLLLVLTNRPPVCWLAARQTSGCA